MGGSGGAKGRWNGIAGGCSGGFGSRGGGTEEDVGEGSCYGAEEGRCKGDYAGGISGVSFGELFYFLDNVSNEFSESVGDVK